MYSIAQLKVGTAIKVDGHPYVVTSSQFSKQARGGGVMKTTVKSLLTGNSLPMTFQGNEKIEPADITYSKAQYLYKQDEAYFFMDNETYEQFQFGEDDLGDQGDYLVEGSEVDIQNFDNKPINVKLPPKVDLEVVEAPPAVKGDTAQGKVTKSIKLETGVSINAPIFIKVGDVVRINTETGEYCERVNK
jgi:elongation factor P